MEKITLKKAKDEVLGAFVTSLGVVAGSLVMKMAAGKVNKWLVPGIGLMAGLTARIASDNAMLKDVGTGLLIAGTMDLTKKGLTALGDKVPFAATINDSIPTLSGLGDPLNFNTLRDFRGVGNIMEAQVVESRMLRR